MLSTIYLKREGWDLLGFHYIDGPKILHLMRKIFEFNKRFLDADFINYPS